MSAPPGLASALAGLLRRDLVLALRNRGEVLTALLFFVIVVTLFPLGVTPELETPGAPQAITPKVASAASRAASASAIDSAKEARKNTLIHAHMA